MVTFKNKNIEEKNIFNLIAKKKEFCTLNAMQETTNLKNPEALLCQTLTIFIIIIRKMYMYYSSIYVPPSIS